MFNIGLYWIPTVKKEYFLAHPLGVNPVLLNDVVFALHAVVATTITVTQCLIYYRGDQRISKTALVILSLTSVALVISLFVAVGGKITWLVYLQIFSYVKLVVTLIKYIPQAWMNFRRKSTDGWSIGNVLLDFTGGSLSILQMFLQSYNNNDWTTIFGDFTKFGLGLFSVLFDCLFIVQHYILYKATEGYANIESEQELLSED
ncbi:DgyrCDS1947 [Dimorphilus gyrociliatus]|uniref:DgyrCDS1947 n=1 Tax=Dimorphilus gyrociliatus TaxID=2664684 RepID=A0A7I8VAL0_9ANNE|nr:DgyrCDS1947 [Dimorphilus gyrociliatus]